MIHSIPEVDYSWISHQIQHDHDVMVGDYALRRGEWRGTFMQVLRVQPTHMIYKQLNFHSPSKNKV